ncbi:TPA: fimbria/pilus periplasmic chaperone, partial [Escherichia coli]|nr:fimbria/pilus periplasmic chaperone [Escherichia coli]
MKHILLFIFTVLLSLPSYGSVVIMGTRVIYPAEQKSINVRLNNGDSTPSLIQAWLDTGDPSSPPDSVRVPFIITPPVFRMEPLSGQTMRIMYTGEKLPA